MRHPSPDTAAGRTLFHNGGRRGFNILVTPVGTGATPFTLTEDDIYSGGFLHNAASTSSQTIELGSVFASQICLAVIDYDNTYTGINLAGARLEVSLTANDGTNEYTLPFGQYTVDEVKKSENRIDLVALDDFIKFDKAYTEEDYPFDEPTSLYDVVDWICSECGITFGTDEDDMVNADYMVKTAPKGTNITYRQLLSWAAQLTGSCAKFNASTNELEFVWYGGGGTYGVSTDDTFEHNVSNNAIFVSGLVVKQYGKVRNTLGSLDYPLTIEDNGLLSFSDDDYIEALENILDRIGGTTYYPITLTKINDPLIEPLDGVNYTNADGDLYNSFATNVNYAFSDATGIESVGLSEENNGYANGSPFTEEQQSLINGLQGKLMLKKNVYRKDYLVKDAVLTNNGLSMISNASWHYSTDMSKILSSSISGTYTVEITASDWQFKFKLPFVSSIKGWSFLVENFAEIASYISQSPTTRQASGVTSSLVPIALSPLAFQIRIDLTNNNWSVVSEKSIDGATLSIYKETPTQLVEYVEDDSLNFDAEPTEDSENFVSSGSVYDSLESKQDVLIFDGTPTEDSENPVTSGGIKIALDGKMDTPPDDATHPAGTVPVKLPSGYEWMFDSCLYGTFGAANGEDLNAEKFWADRARFYMSGESDSYHVENRPDTAGGGCFVVNLGGLGTTYKARFYITRTIVPRMYVQYRSGSTVQAWQQILTMPIGRQLNFNADGSVTWQTT